MAHIERFAPSPTGPLHLGHAFSALTAWERATGDGGEFLLRLEDIDSSRCRPEWEQQIYGDLEWLGLWWPKPVLRQSTRLKAYRKTLVSLWQQHLIFSCNCSRRDIAEAARAPQEHQPQQGPDGIIYPGTCRNNYAQPGSEAFPAEAALRLNMDNAGFYADHRLGGDVFSFVETGQGPNGETGLIEFTADEAIKSIGDIVLARREMGTSYHLSVVLDDAYQNITHITRGKDLFEATKIHVILQKILGLPTPIYHHHRLIRDESGKRLAKRDDSRAISKYREEGATPQDIREMVGLGDR